MSFRKIAAFGGLLGLLSGANVDADTIRWRIDTEDNKARVERLHNFRSSYWFENPFPHWLGTEFLTNSGYT